MNHSLVLYYHRPAALYATCYMLHALRCYVAAMTFAQGAKRAKRGLS